MCLWLAYLVCNTAFSLLSPFFPEEVMQPSLLSIATTDSKVASYTNIQHIVQTMHICGNDKPDLQEVDSPGRINPGMV